MNEWVLNLIDGLIVTIITIGVLILFYGQIRKLQTLALSNKSKAKDYGKNVVIGIVAGVVVVIIDKGMTLVFAGLPAIDYTSFWTIAISGYAGFITLLLEAGVILLLVIWIINRGLRGLVRKKNE